MNRNAAGPHPKPCQDKVVAVTGATAGVGRATALEFARQCAAVALIARDTKALRETQSELQEIGARAVGFSADVADPASLMALVATIEQQLGPVDVWVNNAMATVFSRVADLKPEEIRRVTEVTYLGTVHGTMAALRAMREGDRGVIVQVGSALAYRGIPLQAAYCGAKHAIRGFTDSLRCELIAAGSGIQIVMVQLPAMNTPQFDWARTHLGHEPRPVAPVLQPEVAARSIVSAAANPTREVWLGTSTVRTILGSMIAPGMLDRLLARVAISGQETAARVSPDRRDNLEEPVSGLHSTRGSFSAEAGEIAIAPSASAVRLFSLGLIAAGAFGLYAYTTRRRRRETIAHGVPVSAWRPKWGRVRPRPSRTPSAHEGGRPLSQRSTRPGTISPSAFVGLTRMHEPTVDEIMPGGRGGGARTEVQW